MMREYKKGQSRAHFELREPVGSVAIGYLSMWRNKYPMRFISDRLIETLVAQLG